MFTVQLTAPGGSRFVTQCAAYKMGPYRHSRKKFSLVCYQRNALNELEADPLIWVGPEKDYCHLEIFGHDWHEVVDLRPNPESASDAQALVGEAKQRLEEHLKKWDTLRAKEGYPPEQKTPVAHV